MKLQEMSTKSLLHLHNAIAEVPAGPKSFATKTKLIGRLESIAIAKDIDLASLCPVTNNAAADPDMRLDAKITETLDAEQKAERSPTDKGIGRLARELLLDPVGYPHGVVASMVNSRIDGAQTSAKSVRWYACKMRKSGLKVPPRQRRCLVEEVEQQVATDTTSKAQLPT